MQALIGIETMPEKNIDIIILQRLEGEQKETTKRIDKIDDRLAVIGEKVAEIKGVLDAPNESWWMRYVIAPVIVAGILGAIAEVSWLHVRLNTLETQMTGSTSKLQLEQSANTPADPASIKEAKTALDVARNKKIKLPVEIVAGAGAKFVEASQGNPDAWPVALQFIDYRSFLNADFAPSFKDLTPATGKSKYQFSVTTIEKNPEHPESHQVFQVLFAGGYAPPDKSARLELLQYPQPTGSEFAFIVIDGSAAGDLIGLDRAYMKNVIIRNIGVEYDGGPLVLENVYFVNCTFKSSHPTPNGRELGKTLLASASTTFKANQTVALLNLPSRR